LAQDFEFILPETGVFVRHYFNNEFFGGTVHEGKSRFLLFQLPLLSRHIYLKHKEIVTHLVQSRGHKLTCASLTLAINEKDLDMIKQLITLVKDPNNTKISDFEMDGIFHLLFVPQAPWEPIPHFLELDFPLSGPCFNQLIKRPYDLPNYKKQLFKRKEIPGCLLDLDWSAYPDPKFVQELLDHGADPNASNSLTIQKPIQALAHAIKSAGYPRSTATSYFSILIRSGATIDPTLIDKILKDCKRSKNRENVLIILNGLIWDSQLCRFFREEVKDLAFLSKICQSLPLCGDYNPYSVGSFFKNLEFFTDEQQEKLDPLLNKLLSGRATCCVHGCRGKYFFPKTVSERKTFGGSTFCLWHHELYIPSHVDIAYRFLPRTTFVKPCAMEFNPFAILSGDILLQILQLVGPLNTHVLGETCQSWYTFYQTVLPNPPKLKLIKSNYTSEYGRFRRVFKIDVPRDQSVGVYFRGEVTKYKHILIFPQRPEPGRKIKHIRYSDSSLEAKSDGGLFLESITEVYSYDPKYEAHFQYIWPIAINSYGMNRGAHFRTPLV